MKGRCKSSYFHMHWFRWNFNSTRSNWTLSFYLLSPPLQHYRQAIYTSSHRHGDKYILARSLSQNTGRSLCLLVCSCDVAIMYILQDHKTKAEQLCKEWSLFTPSLFLYSFNPGCIIYRKHWLSFLASPDVQYVCVQCVYGAIKFTPRHNAVIIIVHVVKLQYFYYYELSIVRSFSIIYIYIWTGISEHYILEVGSIIINTLLLCFLTGLIMNWS